MCVYVCADPEGDCRNGDVRLADGDREGVGRVEVCVGGVWSSHCGYLEWDNEDAQVVCRQLGFSNPESESLVCTGQEEPD